MDDINDIRTTNDDQSGVMDQQNQYGQHNQYGQYGQVPDPQPELFPQAPPKKKISLAAVITVIVIVLVFVVGLLTLAPSYTAARKYGKALVNNKDVDELSEMVFPEKLVKDGGDVYDAYKGVVSDSIREIRLLGKAKFSGVKAGKSIKSGDLRDIEKYYKIICDFADVNVRVNIEKGYEYKIKFKAGDEKYYQECCVIKMKGEGWKVFHGSLDELKTAMAILDNYEDMDFDF